MRALAATAVALAAAAGPARAEPDAEAWLLDAADVRVLRADELAAQPARFPFPVGERLTYAVSWFGVPAGTATIEIARFVASAGRRYAHVVAEAHTSPLFSLFYEVDDRTEAWIDLDCFCTARTRAVERHGDKVYDERVRYDWDTHFLSAQLEKLHKGQRREVDLDLGPFAYDTSDLVYVLRALPLETGYRVGVPTQARRKVFEFRIDVGAPSRIEATPFGDVEALAVRPSTHLDGRPYAAGEGTAWVAGPARVPVQLDGWIRTTQGSFRVGGLRARLVAYVAGAPGWPAAVLPVDAPRTAVPATRDGIPQWEPPAPVRAARRAAGLAPRDTGFTLPLAGPARHASGAGAETGTGVRP